MYSKQVGKYNKCHIQTHTSLYDFSFDFLIFSDLLSYENNQEFIFKAQLQSPFLLLYSLHIRKLWCVFFLNAFLEENKGVHKLEARTAIRQSLWLEKNNYPEARLLRASSTTQPPVKIGQKKEALRVTQHNERTPAILTSLDITEHNYQLKQLLVAYICGFLLVCFHHFLFCKA